MPFKGLSEEYIDSNGYDYNFTMRIFKAKEHENYGSKRLQRFLEFAVKRMHYLADDNENYYQEMNEYFIKRFGVNVFESMGVEIIGADLEPDKDDDIPLDEIEEVEIDLTIPEGVNVIE